MRKNVKVLCSIAIVLLMVLVCGCEKKPNNVVPTEEEKNVLKVSSDTKSIGLFNEILKTLSFTNNSKASSYNIVSAFINEGEVEVRFAIENVDKKDDEKNYKSHNLELKEKAVSVSVSYDNNTKEAYVYVISESGKLYLVTVNETTAKDAIRYDVSDIAGIATLYGCLEEGKEDNKVMVFIKTNSGHYYTDYQFSTDTDRVLREVINKETEQ